MSSAFSKLYTMAATDTTKSACLHISHKNGTPLVCVNSPKMEKGYVRPRSDWAIDSTGMPCRRVKREGDPLSSAVKAKNAH